LGGELNLYSTPKLALEGATPQFDIYAIMIIIAGNIVMISISISINLTSETYR
jgi:hypothetical protein